MPHQKKNLLGQQFGNWTVIAEAPSIRKANGKLFSMWTCQCKCGTIKDIQTSDLTGNRTTSCKSCAAKKRALKQGKQLQKKKENNKDYSLYLKDHPRIKDLSGYQFKHYIILSYNSTDKRGESLWNCQCECGKIFIARQHEISSGKRINCGCSKKSNGEIKIEDILKENNIKYQMEYKFDDLKDILPLRFDFAIFDNNNNLVKLIEFQGEQHYKNQPYFKTSPIEHDKIKKQYCKEHNIKLLEIPYWDYNKIDINYLLTK